MRSSVPLKDVTTEKLVVEAVSLWEAQRVFRGLWEGGGAGLGCTQTWSADGLRVHLEGWDGVNRDAVGAWVELTADGRSQRRRQGQSQPRRRKKIRSAMAISAIIPSASG